MDYKEQLKHPKWQKKRLEILQRDDFTCQNCGEKEKTLHVHHKYYDKDLKAWEYINNSYVTYCEECHEYIHIDIKPNENTIINFLYDIKFHELDLDWISIEDYFYMERNPNVNEIQRFDNVFFGLRKALLRNHGL